ncbi:unnamed protein product [Mycena citricolor]|uniref:Uncharacterized protein n=1 Tax=Mycena citricolor TaxID=2018698 RepID=A0AAD2K4T2_9AGAR|nr:unnamed protein product [Mycena citricolor]
MQTPADACTIPISVRPGAQRTLTAVGRGIKAILQTAVSGRLIIRPKRPEERLAIEKRTAGNQKEVEGRDTEETVVTEEDHGEGEKSDEIPDDTEVYMKSEIAGWYTPPPTPGARWPASAVTAPSVWPNFATTEPVDEIHQTLVELGIKVRDFAYPSHCVARTDPLAPEPMKLLSGETSPLVPTPDIPRQGTPWEPPHPSLRPLPESSALKIRDALCKKYDVPMLKPARVPMYETHRIPAPFSPVQIVMYIEGRLSQTPRTIPILGMYTRRLLSISPFLVDLSRYHEMDLEELRRYDARILRRAVEAGIEPYPWKVVGVPHGWAPSPEWQDLLALVGRTDIEEWYDPQTQGTLLTTFIQERRKDDLWENEELDSLAAENAGHGLSPGKYLTSPTSSSQKASLDPDTVKRFVEHPDTTEASEYFRDVRAELDLVNEDMLTGRQKILTWFKRRDSYVPEGPEFDYLSDLVLLLGHVDRAARLPAEVPDGPDVRALTRQFYPGMRTPFIPGLTDPYGDVVAYWGPDAVWDLYRMFAAPPPTEPGKTLNHYLETYSTITTSATPIVTAVTDDSFLMNSISSNVYDVATYEESAQDIKTARRLCALKEERAQQQALEEAKRVHAGRQSQSPPLKRKAEVDELPEGETESKKARTEV